MTDKVMAAQCCGFDRQLGLIFYNNTVGATSNLYRHVGVKLGNPWHHSKILAMVLVSGVF